MAGLYIHIPFCVQKCLYCDFYSVPNRKELESAYVDALVRQISSVQMENVTSVYIGGGTPTSLECGDIEKLLSALNGLTPMEFTVEANPKTVDAHKLEILKNGGVTRLSIGMQAWQDSLLKLIGRTHNHADFLEAIGHAKEYGFDVNADAMFNLPSQTLFEWEETIRGLIYLDIPHVSCYSLTVAENTPFGRKLPLPLPDEDTEREMYHMAVDMLGGAGIRRYEISNFAKTGFECLHNLCYWHRDEYYAFGAGAHGFLNGRRFYYNDNIEEYIKNPVIRTEEILSRGDEMTEFCILSLRLSEGISKKKFRAEFSEDVNSLYKSAIDKNESLGLIGQNNDRIFLTDRGFDLANTVMEDFIS